jgi:putative ABC transport system permease protein
VIGIGLGIGISFLASNFAHWPTLISGFSVILGFASAALTGVVFGFYPARRVAALDPIDALRYE